jgi:hypothetical protein
VAPGGPAQSNEGEATMAEQSNINWVRKAVDWKLQSEVTNTREAIVHRARSLAERLTRLADGLEADQDYSLNTIGELQGNGVELDTWCAKYGLARDMLKLFQQAAAEEAKG